MKNSNISFTKDTWNPFRANHMGRMGWACIKHGPGCLNCYAESINKKIGTGLPFDADSANEVELILSHGKGQTSIQHPLTLKQGSVIFANSMTDWLWDGYPNSWSMYLFGVMSLATQHVFITLTKRYRRLAGIISSIAQTPNRTINLPAEKAFERAVFRAFQKKRFFPQDAGALRINLSNEGMENIKIPFVSYADVPFTPRNVIFGVSATTNSEMDVAITLMKNLRATFPHIRTMISYEPALESVSLSRLQKGDIDWIDVGGESDTKENEGDARPFALDAWFEVAEFGERTGTPVFFKQAGSVFARTNGFKERKGEDISELPADWKVKREYPNWDTWTV